MNNQHDNDDSRLEAQYKQEDRRFGIVAAICSATLFFLSLYCSVSNSASKLSTATLGVSATAWLLAAITFGAARHLKLISNFRDILLGSCTYLCFFLISISAIMGTVSLWLAHTVNLYLFGVATYVAIQTIKRACAPAPENFK